ncbi:MAG: crossover junction endodeoxyribonuclease RuvC [Bacteroidales bacterium]
MTKINLLGIDPGSSEQNPAAWAIINEEYDLIDSGYFPIKAKGAERAWYTANKFESVCKTYDIDGCVIEKPFSPNPDSLMVLHNGIGAIMYVLYAYDINLVGFYTPNHIKKQATSDGHASKEKMQQKMCEMFGLEKVQKDEADALGTAVTGMRHINGELID